MKKKEYLIVFYDNKKQFVHQFTHYAFKEEEVYQYIITDILHNQMYAEEVRLHHSTIITEVGAGVVLVVIADVDSLFLYNCKDRKLTDVEIQSAVVMSDGKKVCDGAAILCISEGALGTRITHTNEKTGCLSYKASLFYLHNNPRS